MKFIQIQTPKKPHELFAPLSLQKHSFFLDSSEGKGYSFWGARPYKISNNLKDIQTEIDRFKDLKYPSHLTHIPFLGGAVGFLSYEAARAWEKHLGPAKKEPFSLPDIWFGFYDTFFAHEHKSGKTHLISLGLNADSQGKFEDGSRMALRASGMTKQPMLTIAPEILSNMTFNSYQRMIKKAKHHIEQGDIYQVNLSQCLQAKVSTPSYGIYQKLRTANPGNFSAYINLQDQQILSSSPERFIQVSKDGMIQTQPIKGTICRGKSPKEDEILKKELLQSQKNNAELMMIVDLMRNDLGKICEFGSVHVPKLVELKTYASVHHLVSTVTGKLKTKKVEKIIQACFPGGSITGAPKLRAMQIIDELEPHNRGIYTGSIGYVDYRGQIDLNIAIRTMVRQKDMIYLPLGGGIVSDSLADEEFKETLHKGYTITQALLH